MLLTGRKGLVIGVSNSYSLGWAIARSWRSHGATEVAIGVQSLERFGPVVSKLALEESGGKWKPLIVECDVNNDDSLAKCYEELKSAFDNELDMLVHSVAFAPKECLKGNNNQTGILSLASRSGFLNTMETSVFSFIAAAKTFAPMLQAGAIKSKSPSTITTLTFDASARVIPEYGIMGPAKAALETCCRYAAHELGRKSIRVNGISAGPVNTASARGLPNFRSLQKKALDNSPLGHGIGGDDVGSTASYLASDLASAVTGQILYVDSGNSIVR